MASILHRNQVGISLNTNGCCVICLKCIRGKNSLELKNENAEIQTYSVSTLFRYLKVNVEKAISAVDSSSYSKSDWYDTTVELCSGCSEINKNVQELERVIETAKMKISYQLSSIHEKMRDAGRTPSRMTRYHRRMKSDPASHSSMAITQSLRNKILQESKGIASTYQPRVVVTKSDTKEAEAEQLRINKLGEDSPTNFILKVMKPTDVTPVVSLVSEFNCKTEREESPQPENDTDFNFDLKIDLENSPSDNDSNKKKPMTVKKSPIHCCCLTCGKIFKSRKYLDDHINNVHLKLRQFKCALCVKSFFLRNDLTRHRNSVHYKVKYQCNVPGCSKRFAIPPALRKHRRIAHPEAFQNDRITASKYLEGKRKGSRFKSCNSSKVTKSEIKKESSITNQCEICGKTFGSGSNRKAHYENIHLGIRKFECGICDKRFSFRNGAQKHRDTVHVNNIIFPCNFPGCGKTYSCHAEMTRHRKCDHQVERSSNQI